VKRVAIVVAVIVLLSAYVVEGVGYHRVSKACWQSRHGDSAEGEVYGGGIGLAFDVALWPVYLAADGFDGRDCG
jgi:hypothetical protein